LNQASLVVRGKLAIAEIAVGLFLKMQGFFKNTWHFKDIFTEFEAFLQ
jgi:hypothetical protein